VSAACRRAGKGVKNAEGGVLDADEVAEDIYEGLDDDTRAPSKPQQVITKGVAKDHQLHL
jgi:hypothetical protein